MTTTRKRLWAITGFYAVAGIVVLIILFGFGHQNHSFQVQNEFKRSTIGSTSASSASTARFSTSSSPRSSPW